MTVNAAERADGERSRVVFVEQDPAMIDVFTRAANNETFEPVVVSTIEQAERTLSERRACAVIADVHIGGVSTVALALTQREQHQHRAPKFLFATDTNDVMDLVAVETHGYPVLSKRLDPDIFARRIGTFLRGAHHTRVTLRQLANELASDTDLSDMQRRVLLHYIDGVPRADLARELGIEETSLRTHIRQLLSKVVATSLEAVYRELLVRLIERLDAE